MTLENATLLEPPNVLPRIESVWAYLSVDENGCEGVVAASMGELGLVPLIAADAARLAQLRGLAEGIAKRTKRRIVLARFTTRVDGGLIDGRKGA